MPATSGNLFIIYFGGLDHMEGHHRPNTGISGVLNVLIPLSPIDDPEPLLPHSLLLAFSSPPCCVLIEHSKGIVLEHDYTELEMRKSIGSISTVMRAFGLRKQGLCSISDKPASITCLPK